MPCQLRLQSLQCHNRRCFKEAQAWGGFIITSIIGVIAVISGIHLEPKKEVIEWIYSGLVIGGVLSIFIGTVSYFNDRGRFVKPLVLLAEMTLIIWIAIHTYSKEYKK